MEAPCDLLHRRPQHTDHSASADLREIPLSSWYLTETEELCRPPWLSCSLRGTCLDSRVRECVLSCGIIPSDVCFWDLLPFSAMDAPDRLFISSSGVAADAASGVPPDPSQTLTLGVEYSLVSVVYGYGGMCETYTIQFKW